MTTRRKILASTLAGLVLVGSGLGVSAFATSQQASDDKISYEGSYAPISGVTMEEAMSDELSPHR